MTTNCKSTKTLSEQLTKNKRISYPLGISPFDRKKIEFVPGQFVLVGSTEIDTILRVFNCCV
jgi:hypothetical protein